MLHRVLLLLALFPVAPAWAASMTYEDVDALEQHLAVDNSTVPSIWTYSWRSQPDCHYLVQVSTDLQNWAFLAAYNPSGTGEIFVIHLPEEAAPTLFIRLIRFSPLDETDSSEDVDGNDLPDPWERYYWDVTGQDPNADPDNDDLNNREEFRHGTNPLLGDTDDDGMPDGWEVAHGLNPKSSSDAVEDPDGDGLTNLQEYVAGSSPQDYYNGNAPFPFFIDFETSEGFVAGPLQGQKGWRATPGVMIASQGRINGALSVSIPDSANPERIDFFPPPSPSSEKILFVDFYLAPVVGTTPDESVIFDCSGARVAYVKNGLLGEFHVFDGNGSGTGVWRRIEYNYTVDFDPFNGMAEWEPEFCVRFDFNRKCWDLQIDGVAVAANLGLLNQDISALGKLTVFGHTASPVYFDSLLITADNPGFTDVDKDNMPDDWETLAGLDPLIDDRDGDADGDGATNIHEYISDTLLDHADSDGDGLLDGFEIRHRLDPLIPTEPTDEDGDGVSQILEAINGTDPNDYYNGATPQITILSGEGNPDGEFVALIHKPDGTPYPSAPVTFEVPIESAALAGNPDSTITHQLISTRADESGIVRVYLRPVTPEP
ncbi:MAG: hypothetical protein NDI75_03820 [Candidatus Didemnitutus sp.]|nr:hypothetical protein [Candidatus Didemnitutus sp.]